uniref:Golgi associated RAB2 interactor protein-like Rab2B-binding domain-containing protein n=1 Tax=Chelonoidis abingdonii TaxID=106734 RepID=A0A8C0G5N4_CHEAB
AELDPPREKTQTSLKKENFIKKKEKDINSISASSDNTGLFLADDPASGVHLGVEGGILCQLLRSPDYNLFPKSAVFESNFIQVLPGSSNELMASHPWLVQPHTSPWNRPKVHYMLLPLRYVRLSVQDSSRRLLRVQVVTGKVYYLRLHQAHPDAVFKLWSRLADILQRGLSITTKDPTIHVPHSLVLSVGSSSTSSPAQVRRPAGSSSIPCSCGPCRGSGGQVPEVRNWSLENVTESPSDNSELLPHKARQGHKWGPPGPWSRTYFRQEAHTARQPLLGSLDLSIQHSAAPPYVCDLPPQQSPHL